jgi:Zn-dependent peptidase ImmA (M78 family)
VLSHELGHVLRLEAADGGEVSRVVGERACDAFAAAFLKQKPETPAQAWAGMRRRLEERASLEAKARGAVLQR